MKKSVIIIAGLACFCDTSLSVMEKCVCFCHEVVSSDCMTFGSDVPSYDTHCHNNYILQTDHTRPEKKYSWCLMNVVKPKVQNKVMRLDSISGQVCGMMTSSVEG